jgi:hypothetical protein
MPQPRLARPAWSASTCRGREIDSVVDSGGNATGGDSGAQLMVSSPRARAIHRFAGTCVTEGFAAEPTICRLPRPGTECLTIF